MNKKEYLAQYRGAQLEMERLVEERTKWSCWAAKIASVHTDEPTNRMEHSMEQIAKMENEISIQINQMADLQLEVKHTIHTLKNDRLETVLYYRYIDGMTFPQIAVKMNYCLKQVRRIHDEALQKIPDFSVSRQTMHLTDIEKRETGENHD